MIRRPPRSTQGVSSAASDVYKRQVLMAQIAGALNGVATKIAISINEVPSGLARSLKQHSEKSES